MTLWESQLRGTEHGTGDCQTAGNASQTLRWACVSLISALSSYLRLMQQQTASPSALSKLL